MALVLLSLYATAATVITGDISTDTTLLITNNPHQIRGTVRVLNGVTLTVDPGVTLLFENNSLLEIQGQISAMGTEELPIWFHSFDSTQHNTKIYMNQAEGSTFSHCAFSRASDYSGLLRIENSGTVNILNCNLDTTVNAHGMLINNSSVNVNNTDLTGISQNGIHIQGSSTVNLFDVRVDGCQTGILVQDGSNVNLNWDDIDVQHCSSYPLFASLFNYPTLSGLTVSYAGIRMLAAWSSNLYDDLSLPYQSLPYYLLSNLNLSNAAELSLEPGVGLRFPQHGKLLLSGGASLSAEGTTLLPISFGPGGDYHWKGISLDVNCSAMLDYCQFSGSGYSEHGYSEPTISANSISSLSILNSSITGGDTHGIFVSGGNNGTITLNNVEIHDCPQTGLHIQDSSITLNYSNLSISECGRALALPANLLNFLQEPITMTNNTDNRIFLHYSGTISRDTTVRNWGYPYVCESINIDVNWVNLMIQPGCEFQMGYSMGFNVNGSINAFGTSELPILFTRLPTSTQNWRGFFLNSGTTLAHFDHCILQHCASSNEYHHIQEAFRLYRADTVTIENTQIIDAYCRAIFIEGSNSSTDNLTISNLSINGCGMDAMYQAASEYRLSIDGLTISGCNAYPLSLSGNWVHQISNINLSGNTYNVIRILNGGFLASQTLINHGYPYQLSGSSLYINNATVSVEPGTVFYLENGISLEVIGTLNALGSQDSPIVFSRPPDATYFWQGINFRNNSHGDLQYCHFTYGGKANEYGYNASLINNTGATQLSMQHCLISNVQAQAISCSEIGSSDSLAINDLQINDCGTDGLWIIDSDLNLEIDSLWISNCSRDPLSILPVHAGTIQNLTLSDNSANEIRLFNSGSIDRSVTFPNFGYVYRCEVSLNANAGTMVTFSPGCEFHMADNTSIYLYGAVQALGTAAQPIIFSRYPASTAYWQGIRIFNSTWDADFTYCHILYAGSADTYSSRRAFCNTGAANLSISNSLIRYSNGHGMMLEEMQSSDIVTLSNLSIQDVSLSGFQTGNSGYHEFSADGLNITNVGDYPLACAADLLDKFTGLSFAELGKPYIYITTNFQSRSATWPNFAVPYFFPRDFAVNDWVTLNITAGTELVFADYIIHQVVSNFVVNGALNTLGTEAEPVIFRGLNPALSSTWLGLRIINPDAPCTLNWTCIMNAGLDENHTYPQEFCLLYIYRGTVNLNNCILKLSNHNLIKIEDNNTTTLNGCTLTDATNGILHYGGTLNLINNTIHNCSGNGIYQSGGGINFGSSLTQWNKLYNNAMNIHNNTANSMTAAYVYWGNTEIGMIDSLLLDNEEGQGEILFEPWLDESCQNLFYITIDIPTGVAIIPISASTLRLSWNAVPTATSYQVLCSIDPSGDDWTILQQDIATTSLDITPQPDEPRRFYRVIAVR